MANHQNVRTHTLHAVVVPFPAQGHIKALITFSELLLTRGFHFITFLNTEWSHKRIFGSTDHASTLPNFRFLAFPDGLPAGHGRTTDLGELLAALQNYGPFTLQMALRSAVEKLTIPPITCIISDAFMSCTHSVATNMGVPRVLFWPVCAAFSILMKNTHSLISEGHIPVKDARSVTHRVIQSLPGNIPPLLPRDLMSFYREQHASGLMYKGLLYECEVMNKGVDYVLINTFVELEGREAAAALAVNGCPAVAIGPVFLPGFLLGRNESVKSSMWEEDESCLKWLDMHPVDSVVYVSFGSLAVKLQQQLEEMAFGLEATGQPFLWVFRSDLAEGESPALPEGFKERTKDRALFVNWAPQLKVLSHPSVGGFLTHSGWNSTVESMSMGVPMLGWPYFGDQSLNCRFAKDVWKVGMDFSELDVDDERLVRREEVESAVRRLMQSDEGDEVRKTARKLKEAAAKAVMGGGSSFENLETFIKGMRQMINKGHRDCSL